MEERVELVKFLLRDGVKLVVVADRALTGERHPGVHRRGGAIHGVTEDIFRIDRAAFAGGHVAAVEATRDELILRRIRKQIAGELLDGELIERQIAIVSADHPVAVGPHRAFVVEMQAVGVAIARLVEPVVRHLFAVARRGKQARHDLLIPIRRPVGDERVSLRRGRRQAGEIESHPPQQGFPIRFGRNLESLLFQSIDHECIDRMPGSGRLTPDFRHHRLHRRLERPMLLVRRTLLDPAFDRLLLRGGQLLVRLRRRHHLVLVVTENAQPHLALRQVAGLDRNHPVFARLIRALRRVEAQLRFAMFGVDPVAGEAVVRKDRPNIAVEGKHRVRHGGDRRERQAGGEEIFEKKGIHAVSGGAMPCPLGNAPAPLHLSYEAPTIAEVSPGN